MTKNRPRSTESERQPLYLIPDGRMIWEAVTIILPSSHSINCVGNPTPVKAPQLITRGTFRLRLEDTVYKLISEYSRIPRRYEELWTIWKIRILQLCA